MAGCTIFERRRGEQDAYTPCFMTYNIEVTHELRYSVHGKVQGEKVPTERKYTVLILRSSGGLPQDNSGRDPSVRQEDESWIVPPPEDAPPTFTEAVLIK